MINDKNNINLEKYPEIKVRINESDFKIRINEHIKRGIIKKDEEKLILSNSGKLLLKISDNLAKIFNLRNWVGI
jgi:hypothetical protein